ncbi:MAG: alpha/beta hydrolase [Actinomycetota bacterium]
MAAVELKREGELAYREARPESPRETTPVLLVHGYPESSLMWRGLLPPLAAAGRRAVAPDLPGYGNSPPFRSGTWEHHVEVVEEFRQALGLDRVVLGVHDWGGLIGMRWACDYPDAVAGLMISNTGFFPDGKWSAMGKTLRTPGDGEAALEGIDRDGLAAMLRATGEGFDDDAIDEYWKAFTTTEGRRGQLELYRSGDFEKLVPYEGRLAALGVPTLIIWGENDAFAPVAGAHRFHKEIPGSKLVLIEGAGHFVYEDDPERTAREIVDFLAESGV